MARLGLKGGRTWPSIRVRVSNKIAIFSRIAGLQSHHRDVPSIDDIETELEHNEARCGRQDFDEVVATANDFSWDQLVVDEENNEDLGDKVDII